MGFGFILVGYIFMCNFVLSSETMFFDVFPDFIGWILLFIGCVKLSEFSKKIRIASFTAIPPAVISLYSFLYGFSVFSFLGEASDAIYEYSGYFLVVFSLAFHYLFFDGARDIADECGSLGSLALRLRISAFASAAYFAAKLVLPLFAESAPGFYSAGVAVLYVVFSVLLLYNEAQIFGCFRQITYK